MQYSIKKKSTCICHVNAAHSLGLIIYKHWHLTQWYCPNRLAMVPNLWYLSWNGGGKYSLDLALEFACQQTEATVNYVVLTLLSDLNGVQY